MTTTPTAVARVSGTIKALEWEARPDILGLHNAKSCDGYWYNVQQVADGVFIYEGHPAGMPDHVGSKHPSLIVAKAAAQADYEARILAQIQPDPEPKPVAWFTEDHIDDKSATTWRKEVADRWAAKGWPVYSLYLHPDTPSSAGTVSVEAAARTEVRQLREALRPFAEYMQTDEGRLDLDYLGNEIPDDQGVGWVYLTHGDFRAALRALAGER